MRSIAYTLAAVTVLLMSAVGCSTRHEIDRQDHKREYERIDEGRM